MGDLADSEGRIKPSVSLPNNDAFKGLEALPSAFDHANLNDNGIAGRELRYVIPELLSFELLNDFVAGHVAIPLKRRRELYTAFLTMLSIWMQITVIAPAPAVPAAM